MAQNSSVFSKWSPDFEAAESNTNDTSNIMPSAVPTDMEAAWQQLERTRLHDPTQIQSFLRSDVQFSDFQSGCNGVYLNEIPEVSPLVRNEFLAINRNPNRTGAQLEDVSPVMDHLLKAPEKRKGRRRASEISEGWVASKNLISERKRREKLKEGLLELRSLVPKITKMDKVSILSDAINHVQDLKHKVEMLENSNNAVLEVFTDQKVVTVVKSSCSDLGTSEAETEGGNQNNSSTNGSCSARSSEVVCRDYQMSSSHKDWNSHQSVEMSAKHESIRSSLMLHYSTLKQEPAKNLVKARSSASYSLPSTYVSSKSNYFLTFKMELDVTKLDYEIYKLNITCRQQPGLLVQLSQAIEAFVIEIVHTNIVVITSTKVTCAIVVKMNSWNDMSLDAVEVDIKKLLSQSGLPFL